MTSEQWTKLQSLVSLHGVDKLRFETTDGEDFEVEDVSHIEFENIIVVLLD